ncbi:sulfatase [Fulvivirgaceae bacterium BMA10]|uniref:Sulfatase n=1 Tax=Splendidivirga corallicola TaxID=3051826 RepID=A0ABT8KH02_9BACT|nr:sulfatase [Fulvivirgaceae bacterium BMA10]
MRKLRCLFTTSLILCIWFSCSTEKRLGQADQKDKKPNIIFFLVDDLGWKDVGFMGSNYYETPNIDKMAKEGMVFTSAYANAPNCAPTRASIMSGLYTPRHGVYTVGDPARGKAENRKLIPAPNNTELEGNFVTLAEALKENGYTNCHVGKWHLGENEETSPEAQGFDINIGGTKAGHPATYFSPYKNPNLSDGPDGEYLTDRLTDEALKFIEQNQSAPFFLYFSHYSVHTPIQAKKNLIEKYEHKPEDNGQDNPKYAAMVHSTDQSLGRVLKKLKELDLDENTIVIFFSDNGGHGAVTTHHPLKGSKGMMYEGGFREPMIVRWPKKIKPGVKSDEPVMGIDFYPTLVEFAGGEPHRYQPDGESLAPLLFQKGSLKRDAIFWHFPAYLQGYKGIKNSGDLVRGWRAVPSGAIRKGDWKLIEDFETGRLELYNLKNDISERKNLADTMPDKRDELLADMKTWRKQLNALVPTEKNQAYVPKK